MHILFEEFIWAGKELISKVENKYQTSGDFLANAFVANDLSLHSFP